MSADLVAPHILAAIGDPARPSRPVPFARELGALPGRAGALAGARTVLGMMTRGEHYLSKLVRRHGPVFKNVMGRDPLVMVADPDLVWSMMRNDEGAWSAALAWVSVFHPLDTSGPLMHDFDAHREVRRLFQPAFSAQAIAGYVSAAQDVYERAIASWLARGQVAFKAEARRMFAEVSARIFMGISDHDGIRRLDRAMQDGWQAVLALRRGSRLSPGWRRARRGVEEIWTLLRAQGHGGTHLLGRLRETQDDADWLGDEHTRLRIFSGIMFGAFDTTASGVASMAYLLARHPDWQERLRREALSLPAGATSPEQLKNLEQTDRVWKESLRLFPVAGQLARVSLRECELGAHRLPPATMVMALSGSTARDPRLWTQPERFDPERFSPARAEDRSHKAAFLPFGAGAHSCIGAQLAGMEVRAFWHALLRRCRFRLRRPYEARHQYLPVGIVSGDVVLELERL